MVRESHANEQMLKAFNSTFLALIPKKEGANSFDSFRPIALCNVAFKIITKLIAERLKTFLASLISMEQGGFVKGRQIVDGIVVAIEVVHSMASSKEKAMFIKLDMSKAYGRVRWSFLQHMLMAFGFHPDWISWVMSCVTTSSFFVLLNGSPSPTFSASRRLRQGDPLSLYLFILLAEGLGKLLRQYKDRDLIKGWSWS